MPDAIYADPRMAGLYDAFNPPAADTAFYARLAGAERRRILDLGCGTGRLACLLAERGHAVTGLDPAAAMLAAARRRPGGTRVRWVEADARDFALGERFDLAVMTGHAFQVFLTDEDIAGVLRTVRRHLAPGGRFAFESRNPRAREWEEWTAEASRERARVDGVGVVEVEYDVTAVEGDRVTFETRYRLLAGAERLTGTSTLRFLSQQEIADHLARAGFTGVRWLGDWDGAPFAPHSREIIAVAAAGD
jgi:SAM-dependent methyltransferase